MSDSRKEEVVVRMRHDDQGKKFISFDEKATHHTEIRKCCYLLKRYQDAHRQ